MIDRKYIVPIGMIAAVQEALHAHWNNIRLGDGISTIDVTLEAVVKWISENPIVPTHKQVQEIADSNIYYTDMVAKWITEWQRQMFLAPVPEIPEEIKDMIIPIRNMDEANGPIIGPFSCREYNEAILSAYNRGRKSKG